MTRPVACPHCGEELEIPPEFRGREVRCAGCRNVFTPPQSRGSEPPLARTSPQDDDLPSRKSFRSDDDDLPARKSFRDDDLPARRSFRDEDRGYRDDEDEGDRPRRRPRRKSGSTAWIWILLASALIFCVLPCGGIMILGVIVAFPDFEPYDSPAGKFRTEFPGTPFTYSEKTEEGLDRHCVDYKRSLPAETYFVHYSDLPRTDRRSADRILADACDRALRKEPGWTEESRTSRMYQGHPAIDLKLEGPSGEAGAVIRVVLAGKRLYQLGIKCEQGIEFDEPRASHFLDAFAVTATETSK